jgi:hypothetical protein
MAKRVRTKLKEQKGTTMILIVCLFLLLSVLGINLLNAVNANVTNTPLELEKEQTMISVGSIYDVVNTLIESGELSDTSTGILPTEMNVSGFKDISDRNIGVKVTADSSAGTTKVFVTITFESSGETYAVKSTYESAGGGKYRCKTCYGMVEPSEVTP